MIQTERSALLILLAAFITLSACKPANRNNSSDAGEGSVPLSLHPVNPHYFLFRGKPTILIGSTEHYGAVMNLDFDYKVYLDELAASGLNVTRTFTGIYVEPSGAFGIKKNTMAPAAEKFICPWARSTEPGYAGGGNKFDISVWDKAYFTRLKDFIREAGNRNIIVELDLFSNFYDTVQWKISPLFYRNNINNLPVVKDWKEVLSDKYPGLLDVQVKMVEKIVSELKDFDNLYYEVCNEPYFGDTAALRVWQVFMTGIVANAEKSFNNKHLISNNIANHFRKVPAVREFVSVYNFHYARPPKAVIENYHLNKVIGDNETGFDGIADATYRREAWDFILAGGAIFNHLDYSFTADNEDGSFIVEKGQPGGGGKALRSQLKILAEFMQGTDFINMVQADADKIKLSDNKDISIRALSGAKGNTAAYISRKDTTEIRTEVQISLQPGSYTITWVNTLTGSRSNEDVKDHKGGWLKITTPLFTGDIALRISVKSI